MCGEGRGGSANVSCGEKETEMTGEKAFLQRKIPNQIIPPRPSCWRRPANRLQDLIPLLAAAATLGGP